MLNQSRADEKFESGWTGFDNAEKVARLLAPRLLPREERSRLHLRGLLDKTFPCTLERIKNAIGIGYLVECCGALGAIATARARVFRIALELLNVARDFVDVSKQATRRLAVEARGRDDRVMTLFALRPCARIELGPVVPALLRRKRGEMTTTRTRIEGFFC